MKYLLDTNTCIRFINGRAPQLRVKLLSVDQEDMVVCSIVKAEMRYGAIKSQTPDVSLRNHQYFLRQFRSLRFDDSAVAYYSVIRASLERKGTPIGSNDLLIAAIALSRDLILVTHNLREFSRIDGLRLDDWE